MFSRGGEPVSACPLSARIIPSGAKNARRADKYIVYVLTGTASQDTLGVTTAGNPMDSANKKIYTLPEAAKLAGVSEDELRCAIKDGLLQADFLQNTGEHHVSHEELDHYMRRTRSMPLTTGLRKRRVLIIDDEINFANIMKLELERD